MSGIGHRCRRIPFQGHHVLAEAGRGHLAEIGHAVAGEVLAGVVVGAEVDRRRTSRKCQSKRQRKRRSELFQDLPFLFLPGKPQSSSPCIGCSAAEVNGLPSPIEGDLRRYGGLERGQHRVEQPVGAEAHRVVGDEARLGLGCGDRRAGVAVVLELTRVQRDGCDLRPAGRAARSARAGRRAPAARAADGRDSPRPRSRPPCDRARRGAARSRGSARA